MKMMKAIEKDGAVRRVAGSREGRAVAAMVRAFAADPVAHWLYPEREHYERDFPQFVRLFGGKAFASGTAHEVADCEGVALWLPPGVPPDGKALEHFLERSVEEGVREETFEVLGQMEAFHPEGPHCYLPMIGVVPERQGRGRGTALLNFALGECDRSGMTAYLESSNEANLPLYERFGFVAVGEIQAGSSPVLYPMVRPGGIF